MLNSHVRRRRDSADKLISRVGVVGVSGCCRLPLRRRSLAASFIFRDVVVVARGHTFAVHLEPVVHFSWRKEERTHAALVDDQSVVYDVHTLGQRAVSSVQLVRHRVDDERHVGRQCDGVGQPGCGSEPVLEAAMSVDLVAAFRHSPAVGRVSFLDVDQDEVGEVCVVSRHSTDGAQDVSYTHLTLPTNREV